MRAERLTYLRRMQFFYLNGVLSLPILVGMFYLLNLVSVGMFLIVIGVLLFGLAFISLTGKGIIPEMKELKVYMEEKMDSGQKKNIRIANTMMFIVPSIFLIAGIILLLKRILIYVSISFSLYVVISLIALVLGNLALYIFDRMFWKDK